jgi:hypothetical protein
VDPVPDPLRLGLVVCLYMHMKKCNDVYSFHAKSGMNQSESGHSVCLCIILMLYAVESPCTRNVP